MRKPIAFLTAIVAAAGLTVAGVASPASAAPTASCLLGPGQWQINFSSTWIHVSGSPQRGGITRLSVTSDEPVDVYSLALQPNGAEANLGSLDPGDWSQSTGAGRYVYRANYSSNEGLHPENVSIVKFIVEPAGGGSSTCYRNLTP